MKAVNFNILPEMKIRKLPRTLLGKTRREGTGDQSLGNVPNRTSFFIEHLAPCQAGRVLSPRSGIIPNRTTFLTQPVMKPARTSFLTAIWHHAKTDYVGYTRLQWRPNRSLSPKKGRVSSVRPGTKPKRTSSLIPFGIVPTHRSWRPAKLDELSVEQLPSCQFGRVGRGSSAILPSFPCHYPPASIQLLGF